VSGARSIEREGIVSDELPKVLVVKSLESPLIPKRRRLKRADARRDD
jgi:hypothetical protein